MASGIFKFDNVLQYITEYHCMKPTVLQNEIYMTRNCI